MNLPVVPVESTVSDDYRTYLQRLEKSSFSGDIEYSYGSRLAVATDNSVYQKLPQAVIHPKGINDLQTIGELANQHPQVKFSARGGGTGTNGQSLTDGKRKTERERAPGQAAWGSWSAGAFSLYLSLSLSLYLSFSIGQSLATE